MDSAQLAKVRDRLYSSDDLAAIVSAARPNRLDGMMSWADVRKTAAEFGIDDETVLAGQALRVGAKPGHPRGLGRLNPLTAWAAIFMCVGSAIAGIAAVTAAGLGVLGVCAGILLGFTIPAVLTAAIITGVRHDNDHVSERRDCYGKLVVTGKQSAPDTCCWCWKP